MDDALVQQTRQQSLGDLPRRTARRVPDKLAIVDGRTRLTFAELDAVVDRAAAALADTGRSMSKAARLHSPCSSTPLAPASNCWLRKALSSSPRLT